MKAVLIGAAAIIAVTLPVFAQGAADVAKVAKEIEADKAKLKTYCDMQNLYNEAYEAGEKKDEKKSEELAAKADDMGKSLGADYDKIVNAGADLDPESKEGQEFYKGFESLDKACEGN